MSSQDDPRPVCPCGNHSYPGHRRCRAASAEGRERGFDARAVRGAIGVYTPKRFKMAGFGDRSFERL